MDRPLLCLSLFLGLGTWLGAGVGALAAGTLLALAGGLVLLALAALAPRAGMTALAAAAFALGGAAAGVERAGYERASLGAWLAAHDDPDEPVHLDGVAVLDARDADERWGLVVDVDHLNDAPMRGRVRVSVTGAALRPEVIEGDRIGIWATLRRPAGYADPGVEDALEQARREGVHAVGRSKSPLLVQRNGRGVSPLAGAPARARRWARRTLRRLVVEGPEQGLVRAMVLGDRTGVDPGTAEAFRIAGTYHVLAISGAQVALLAGFLVAAARACRLSPAATGLGVSSVVAFYALFVGGEAPVTRAAVMAGVVLIGRAVDLDSDLANLLGLAGGILLLHRPSAVDDAAFQLSFTATLGMLLLTAPVVEHLPRLPLRAEVALAASLAAQLPLTPLLAVHFHRLAPAALALNLLAVPLSGAVLLCGLATLAGAALVPPLAPWLGDAAWIAAHALLRSGEAARFAAWLDLRVPTPGLLAVALLAAGLLLVARGRRLRTAAALVSLGMLGHVVGPGSPPADGLLHVTVLDVGQGDCLVLRTPSGRVRLVDGGGSYEGGFDVGERVVGPYLWSQGIRSIDALLLTHAHPDHVGGAAFLARVFQPAEVWEGPAPQHDPTYAALDAGLRVLPTARRAVAAGMHDAWEGIPVHVLGPRPRRPWRTRNDDSLVAWLRFGSVAVLLPGDAEANEESELPPAPAAILKAPHHGSRTSSTPAFVRATAPAVVVISSGRMNRFGHPHPEIVERYRRLGARVYRTDQDGAVSVATDGLRVWVRTFERGSWQRIR